MDSFELSHFTNVPLGPIRSVAQTYNGFRHDKPKGLWVSVDGEDDWPSWCYAESFGIGALRYRVELFSFDTVLTLTDAVAVLVFTESYGREGKYGTAIDWPAVASEYSGIIIAPYQGSLRLDDRVSWYYGWDCASGCIWDASIVDRVYLLESEAARIEGKE